MRCLTFLSVMLAVISYGCIAEDGDEAPRETTVLRLNCGALEKAAEGYVPVPSGYLHAASISGITAVRFDELVVGVENHLSGNEMDVAVKLMIDYTDFESKIITIRPGKKAEAAFDLPVSILDGHEIIVVIEPQEPEALPEWEAEIDFGQRDMAFKAENYERVPRASLAGGADGCLMKWEGIQHIFIQSDRPDGITATVYTGWDERNFRLAVSVSDEKHFNTRSGSGIWDGDCLQFAFAPAGAEPFNLMLALASGEVRKYQSRGPDTDLFEKSGYSVVRDDEAGQTHYELKMPFEALKMEPEKGVMFGFNTVVFNDDNGEGYDYWIQITPGIAGGWNPDEFRSFILWD